MKNKRLTYYFLPFVVFIWGVVFYKVFTAITKKDPVATSEPVPFIKNDPDLQKSDTIVLIASYKDPFLGYRTIKRKSFPKTEKERSGPRAYRPDANVKVPVQWPEIVYGGIISNRSDNTRTALVNINGKDYLVHEKEVVGELNFLVICEDSITVSLDRNTKSIVRQDV